MIARRIIFKRLTPHAADPIKEVPWFDCAVGQWTQRMDGIECSGCIRCIAWIGLDALNGLDRLALMQWVAWMQQMGCVHRMRWMDWVGCVGCIGCMAWIVLGALHGVDALSGLDASNALAAL